MHAEDEDWRSLVAQADAADEIQSGQIASLQRQIKNDESGPLAEVQAVSGGNLACLVDLLDAGILQNGPAALPHYRVIVDQQNAGH
jgi:hypothetical protein